MKKINLLTNIVIAMITVSGLAFVSGCGGGGGDPEPEKTEAEKTTTLMTASAWKIQSSAVDGVDQSGLFKNFTIAFTSSGFSTTNGGPVWPATGTWTFVDATAKSFTRSDGVTVSIDTITDTALTLSLTWTKTTFGGGKTSSTSGKNVFVLGK